MVRGPMIGAVTAGRVSNQARATVEGSWPELGTQILVLLELRAVRLDGRRRPGLRNGGLPSRSLRTTPPRRPPCSGDHGMTPSP